ncbi:OsmC family protein [Patiriisocius hiemis]|uniref:OsmC family protein n=1 Tax=Patiriisocius hiemis TaxID=3075604 RepID=A0ABU2YET4_9FLAO|nr:OsmC family protein [Constantimarinum sp. W242]MDT0556169.1 OsmC family protein [Constantimarinum sp. W242]
MSYSISATAAPKKEGVVNLNETFTPFGISKNVQQALPSPAHLFLGSLAACILKNIHRFSIMMNFDYQEATIIVSSNYAQKPSRLENINYKVEIVSNEDRINTLLLQRNLSKFGTIYNMIASSTEVSGTVTHKRTQIGLHKES